METLGNSLRTSRERKGLTQVQVAAVLGITDKAVSHWEKDKNRPPPARLPEIAGAYGMPLAELQKWYPPQPELEGLMEQTLAFYGREAEQHSDQRLIFQGLSTRGFLTSEDPSITRHVCEAAASGVYFVYIAAPGTTSPLDSEKALKKRFQETFKLNSDTLSLRRSSIARRIWLIRPKNDRSQQAFIARLLGLFCRTLVVYRSTGRHAAANVQPQLRDLLIPAHTPERFWLDIDVLDPRTNQVSPSWIPVPVAGTSLTHDYAVELSYWMDHDDLVPIQLVSDKGNDR